MATVRDDAKSADAPRERLLARYPTVLFFLLSFVLTWGYFWLIFPPLHLPDSLESIGRFRPSHRSVPRASYRLGQARSA